MTEKQYPKLPEPEQVTDDWSVGGVIVDYFTGDQMRAYVDADRAMRAARDAEDAARLDYLIESRAIVVSDPDSAPGYWLEFISPGADRWVQIGEYPTQRAAIDAARAAKEGEPQ